MFFNTLKRSTQNAKEKKKGRWSNYLPDKIGLLVIRLGTVVKSIHSFVIRYSRKNNVNEKEIIHYEKDIFGRIGIRKRSYR